jgi:hypothetical protein
MTSASIGRQNRKASISAQMHKGDSRGTHSAAVVHLAHEVGEVETRSGEGEGRSGHPHPALRADLSHFVGEAYEQHDTTIVRGISPDIRRRLRRFRRLYQATK